MRRVGTGGLFGSSVSAISSEIHCCEIRMTRQGPKLRVMMCTGAGPKKPGRRGMVERLRAPSYRTEEPKSSSWVEPKKKRPGF
jgi:hypothetical protein